MPLTAHSIPGRYQALLALIEVLCRGTPDHQLVTDPFHQILYEIPKAHPVADAHLPSVDGRTWLFAA